LIKKNFVVKILRSSTKPVRQRVSAYGPMPNTEGEHCTPQSAFTESADLFIHYTTVAESISMITLCAFFL
jgi:hypothetical protein